jgi:hypothetical protein
VKKPTASSGLGNSTSAAEAAAEEDGRIETATLVEELKERLQKTELASEQYQKQIEVLQSRFDDALKEQGKLEEKMLEEEERMEGLENEKREHIRQRREFEAIYEAERAAAMKEKEASLHREEELQAIIHRLKESLSQREPRSGTSDDGRLSRACKNSQSGRLKFDMLTSPLASSPTLDHFAPSSSLQRSNSKNNSKLILQKDKVIESLRLELAEHQIKLVEMENMGGGRMQELERTLLETRMTNARLMEDNESYQLLLSEKTLNGDFSRNDILRNSGNMDIGQVQSGATASTSLADELSSVIDADQDVDSERLKRVELELSTQKDQNKALTLYINKIIERILQHQGGFENILSNHDDDDAPTTSISPKKALSQLNKDKDLPPPPPGGKENAVAGGGQSFLQRAKSVAYGANKPRPRPTSTYVATSGPPGVTEDLATAPRIPLSRTKSNRMSMINLDRRGTDWNGAAAAVVGNMYRGPSGEHAQTPTSPGLASPPNSFFPLRTPSGNAPTVSSIKEDAGSDNEDAASERARKSALDALNGGGTAGDGGTTDAPSPPRSVASRDDRNGPAGSAPVMTGRQMRPLRLVQEAAEEDKANKANNRASWLPANVGNWFAGAAGGKPAEGQGS